MENAKKEERRAAFRDPVQILVDVILPDGNTVTMRARDLSRTGTFLEKMEASDPMPTAGSKIHLTIKWPIETAAPAVQVTADVMRETEEGVGVQFEF
ncbi:MAG: PilZ domain-containing protein [Gammaproteobacteria bacterium]|nr:PilZ domain-containing protein [Gammaproteobacteria bacterium]